MRTFIQYDGHQSLPPLHRTFLDFRSEKKELVANLMPPRELMQVVANSTMIGTYKRENQFDQKPRLGFQTSPQKKLSEQNNRPVNLAGSPFGETGNQKEIYGRPHEVSEIKRSSRNRETTAPFNKQTLMKTNYQPRMGYGVRPGPSPKDERSAVDLALPLLGRGAPTRFKINTGPEENEFNSSALTLTAKRLEAQGFNDKQNEAKEDQGNYGNKGFYAIGTSTRTGISPPGQPAKINQDIYFVSLNTEPPESNFQAHFFGVCDGHGMNGHLVSGFLQSQLPATLKQLFSVPEENQTPQKLLTKTYAMVSDSLLATRSFNILLSGSTAVSCLLIGSKIFTANVGDSRAIVVRQRGQSQLFNTKALSRDHKADDPIEKARILAAGGRVEPFRDQFGRPLGPARVWKKDEYSPGLAMARAFADVEGRSCGLTSEPDVTEHNIVPEDKAIVLGSDGIYDFLSNEEIASTIMKFYPELDAKKAADSLVTRAAAKWKQNSIICDDLTCIVVFI